MILGNLQAFPKEIVLTSDTYVTFVMKKLLLRETSCQKLQCLKSATRGQTTTKKTDMELKFLLF